MNWFVASLRENPELAIFLTLALGFAIGRVRVYGFSLGNVVGTLLAGVFVGQLGLRIDPIVKVVFFDLFLFATGYKVGPQFFRGLRKNAFSQALLTAVLCVVSLLTAVVTARVMGYDSGTAAGLLAGAFTESTVIGTAGNTIARLEPALTELEYFDLSLKEAKEIAAAIAKTVAKWREMAGALGMTKSDCDRLASAFEHEDLALALKWATSA